MSRAADICFAYAERMEKLADEFRVDAVSDPDGLDEHGRYWLGLSFKALQRARDDLAEAAVELS
jgi:hypothetical protein